MGERKHKINFLTFQMQGFHIRMFRKLKVAGEDFLKKTGMPDGKKAKMNMELLDASIVKQN